MSEPDGNIDIEIACPGCGAEPLLTVGDTLPSSLDDFIGRQCVKCNHTMTGDDIKLAMKAALDKFIKGRFGK
ncbi:hypothetical protein NPS33_05755 [Pseudomonas putida]|uniref:ECs_2282 family putative zinc-binding protein n=1 Tax=Pseudomonas putida TaxID=303 RepID=UPI0023641800|nr:hypothetical protein [Pseudomonas putida]MDD2014403.1 hypothetical protein [Pseudomonas putida]HDS1772030.1 hypothetical protein [Pseudomonas putida]